MPPNTTLYILKLDFNTKAHIIGLGREAHFDKLVIKSHVNRYHMEKITLEGDFNDSFDVYAGLNQQSLVRYIFDPLAMVHFMDFFPYNFWEIVGSEMYVAITSNHENSTSVLKNAVKLLDEIRPAVAIPPEKLS